MTLQQMMPQTKWSNDDQTTVYIEFSGQWQPHEFTDAQQQLQKLLDEVGHSVSVIVNILEPRPLPMDTLKELSNFLSMSHPNRREVIFIISQSFSKGFHEVLRRLFAGELPDYVHITYTIDEAERLLTR